MTRRVDLPVSFIMLVRWLLAISLFSSSSSHHFVVVAEHGASSSTSSSWSQVGQTLEGEDADDYFGLEFALSGDGNRLVVGAPYNDGRDTTGVGDNNNVTSFNSFEDFFNEQLSNLVGHGIDQGHVRIFELSKDDTEEITWVQIGGDIDGGEREAAFGRSVATNFDGTRIVVGSPWKSSAYIGMSEAGHVVDVGLLTTGRVEVFEFYGGRKDKTSLGNTVDMWKPVGLPITGTQDGELCGSAVGMNSNGTRIAVASLRYSSSASEHDQHRGRIRIFDLAQGAVDSSSTTATTTTYSWIQVGQDILGEDAYDNIGNSLSLQMSSDGTRFAFGGAFLDLSTGRYRQGYAQVYELVEDADGEGDSERKWIQLGSDIMGDSTQREASGNGLSLSGNGQVLAIGSPNHSNDKWYNQGRIRVYQWKDNDWTLLGQEIHGPVSEANIGSAIDLSEDGRTLVAGASEHGRHGSVFVYQYNETLNEWISSTKSTTSQREGIAGINIGDFFGAKVSIANDGSRFASSSPKSSNEDTYYSFGGYIQVYDDSNTTTTIAATPTTESSLTIPDTTEVVVKVQQLGDDIDGESEGDESGYALGMSGDGKRVAIGAPYNDVRNVGNDSNYYYNAGHVRVYEYNTDAWKQIGMNIDGPAEESEFGTSVAMNQDGTRLVVGAPWTPPASAQGNSGNYISDVDSEEQMWMGSIHIYEEERSASGNGDQSRWMEVTSSTTIPLHGDEPDAMFGKSVAMNGNGTRVVVGIPRASSNISMSEESEGPTKERVGCVKVYEEFEKESWTQLGQTLCGINEHDEMGHTVKISQEGDRIMMAGGWYNWTGGEYSHGYVQIYDYDEDSTEWIQVGRTISENLDNIDDTPDGLGEGLAMAANGQIIAIGAKMYSSEDYYYGGHIRVYKDIDNEWIQMGDSVIEGPPGAEIGQTIDLSADGKRLIVSAPEHAQKGYVLAYEWRSEFEDDIIETSDDGSTSYIPGTWVQLVSDDTEDYMIAQGEAVGDYFGYQVQISDDGTRFAVSSPNNHDDGTTYYGGHVRVYELSTTANQDESLSSMGTIGTIGTTINPSQPVNMTYVPSTTNTTTSEGNQSDDIVQACQCDPYTRKCVEGEPISIESPVVYICLAISEDEEMEFLDVHSLWLYQTSGSTQQLKAIVDGDESDETFVFKENDAREILIQTKLFKEFFSTTVEEDDTLPLEAEEGEEWDDSDGTVIPTVMVSGTVRVKSVAERINSLNEYLKENEQDAGKIRDEILEDISNLSDDDGFAMYTFDLELTLTLGDPTPSPPSTSTDDDEDPSTASLVYHSNKNGSMVFVLMSLIVICFWD